MYQQQIQFFWPLTEQIDLDLDYTGCANEQKSRLFSEGTTVAFHAAPTWTTNIAPQLTVSPINSVGQLSIGGIQVGMESEPKWYQKLLYKVLGFNWKNK
jgi:hypothetical protein